VSILYREISRTREEVIKKENTVLSETIVDNLL
jgi:hypothetical protein